MYADVIWDLKKYRKYQQSIDGNSSSLAYSEIFLNVNVFSVYCRL